jgi:hypothetical protein
MAGPITICTNAFGRADMKKDQTILVNEKPFPIGTNLFKAIKSIRCYKHTRFLFIDAICINQHSYSERSQQVPLIREIYEKSRNLLVWVDERKDYDKDAKHLWKTCPESASQWNRPPEGRESLDEIFASPWFNRRWTLSEILLSSNATILYDGKAFKWNELLTSVKRCVESGPKDPEGPCNLSRQMKFLKVADDFQPRIKQAPVPSMPLELAVTFQDFACTDPRDRVYSLLGLAPEAFKELGIHVDYSDTPENVFIQFSQAMLAQGNLDILHFCSGESRSSDARLPSWCPDWSNSDNYSWTAYKQRRSGILPPKPHTRNTARVEDFKGVSTLHVSGLLLDQVFQPAASSEITTMPEDRLADIVAASIVRQDCIHPMFTPPDVRNPGCPCRFFHDRNEYSSITSASSTAFGRLCHSPQIDSLLIQQFKNRKSLFLTEKGVLGVGPQGARPGDVIAIIYGTSVPLVLREDSTDRGHYTIIGDFCLPILEYTKVPQIEQEFVLI